MRSIYLSQAFASEAVFMHLLFAPLCQNLSKPRNLSYFPLKNRSRPKKGENRPRLRTERLDSWVSKIARLREDTTQKATRNFCSQRYQPSRVTTLQKHRHPASSGGDKKKTFDVDLTCQFLIFTPPGSDEHGPRF